MRELAIKHKEYILASLSSRTTRNGKIAKELAHAYTVETGHAVGKCGSCIINIVLPAYKKIIDSL